MSVRHKHRTNPIATQDEKEVKNPQWPAHANILPDMKTQSSQLSTLVATITVFYTIDTVYPRSHHTEGRTNLTGCLDIFCLFVHSTFTITYLGSNIDIFDLRRCLSFFFLLISLMFAKPFHSLLSLFLPYNKENVYVNKIEFWYLIAIWLSALLV